MDDVAFLVMDLAKRERSDLAFALLSRYLETGGDYDGVRLLPFYAVYRALVRAKVEVLRGAQLQAVDDDLEQRVRRDLAAAASWMEPQHPTMVLMHGVSGSGKSWLSERLVPELRAVRMWSESASRALQLRSLLAQASMKESTRRSSLVEPTGAWRNVRKAACARG
jgi:2-phosphoglycerate kinase